MIQPKIESDLGTGSIIEDVVFATMGGRHEMPPVIVIAKERGRYPYFRWQKNQTIAVDYPQKTSLTVGEWRQRFDGDGGWHENHPRDPLVMMIAALHRRLEIGDWITRRRASLRDCAASHSSDFKTTNSKLAATFHALGVPHSMPHPETGSPEMVMTIRHDVIAFDLPTKHEMTTEEASKLWNDRFWYVQNPSHPLALLRWVQVNFDTTLDFCNNVLPHMHQHADGIDWFKQPNQTQDGPRVILPTRLPDND